MLALGAELVAVGTKGERRIPVGTFFTGPFTTSLKPDEILVEIRIPTPPARSGGAYLKLERKVGDFATVRSPLSSRSAPVGRASRWASGSPTSA
jgi:carbon-monoxide dehydrogenase medium subunit